MSKPGNAIVSAKTRNEWREYLVGGVLREIADAFDGAGVACDLEYSPPVSGQRRTLVEQYYHTVDWTDSRSVGRAVRVYETELRTLYAPVESFSFNTVADDAQRKRRENIAERLLYWLSLDDFTWVGNRLVHMAGSPTFEALKNAGQVLEGSHLAQQIERMKDSIESDPSLAIGTAKELIETVCKTILLERGKTIEGTPDIPTLTKLLLKELKLVPQGIQDAQRGADLVRAVLRSLGTIGNDLGQLRGLYGTGHGKTARTQPLQPRHARLAVGAASTLVTFLFETHQANPIASELAQTNG